jgi:hypothetical protein
MFERGCFLTTKGTLYLGFVIEFFAFGSKSVGYINQNSFA